MRIDDTSPFVAVETMILDRVKVQAHAAITPEVALQPDVRFFVDHMAHRLILQLQAEVLEDRRHHEEETLRFVEQPVYRNWKQHLVASLPVDSFRRRFLERFWEIDKPNGTRITHEVTLIKRAIFPGNRTEYPRHLGPVQYIVSHDIREWPEEEAG